jgi:hypothetical protein
MGSLNLRHPPSFPSPRFRLLREDQRTRGRPRIVTDATNSLVTRHERTGSFAFDQALSARQLSCAAKDEVRDIEGEREAVRIETERPRPFAPGNELIESVRIGTYEELCFIRELCAALGTRHGGRQRGKKLAHTLARERPPATFAYGTG